MPDLLRDARVAQWDHTGRDTAIGKVCNSCRHYWPCVTWRLADAVVSCPRVSRAVDAPSSVGVGPVSRGGETPR